MADSPIFSLEVVSQIVSNVLGTPHISMASKDRFPKSFLKPTHTAAVVTLLNLRWCNIIQYPCLPLKFLTLDATDINIAVLSLLIPPLHNFLEKLGLPDTKK